MRRLAVALGLTGLLAVLSSPPVLAANWFRWCWLGGSCWSVPVSPAYPGITPSASSIPPFPSSAPTITPVPTPTPTPSPTPTPTAPPPSGLRIVSNSLGNNTLAGGANVVIAAPSSITTGNVEIAVLASSVETYTPPSGWTLYATAAGAANTPQLSVFLKTATGSEPASYTFVSNNGANDAINAEIFNVIGASTTSPINGMFSKYTTTSAATIGTAAVSIPTVLGTLPIAINAIEWLAPSNSSIPSGLTGGWIGQSLAVMQNPANYNDYLSNNGYNAIYAAQGLLTTSTSASVTAGWTWGGASSVFTGASTMLFVNPSGSSTPAPTPTPTPTPTPPPGSNCALPFSAPNGYPDDCWQPYAANSVWNSTIASYGSAAIVDPNSGTYQGYYSSITTGRGQPFFTLNAGYTPSWATNNDYGHPIYFGHSSDPVYTATCTQPWSASSCPSASFHMPGYAKAALAGDKHLGVIDESNTSYVEYDFWQASIPGSSGGNIVASSGSYGPVTGSGLNGNTTHGDFFLWAGLIRQQEFVQGQINHAIFIVAPCASTKTVYPVPSFVVSDTICSGGSGAPYGAWLRLNMTDAQILSLGAPIYKVPIYMAAAHYGMIVGDTNNSQSFGMGFENDVMYTSAGYTNANCPTNGADCTPATAYLHTLGDPGWNGSTYSMNLTEVNWSVYGQWLLPTQ